MELRGGGEELDPEYAKALQDRQVLVTSPISEICVHVLSCLRLYVWKTARLRVCMCARVLVYVFHFSFYPHFHSHNAHFVLYPQT